MDVHPPIVKVCPLVGMTHLHLDCWLNHQKHTGRAAGRDPFGHMSTARDVRGPETNARHEHQIFSKIFHVQTRKSYWCLAGNEGMIHNH